MSTYTDVPWMMVNDHDATTGNGYVTHTCQGPYKGRVQRTGHTTITTEGQNPASAVVNFVQLPLSEYVAFDEVSYAATAVGGQMTITGRTNAPRLDFALTRNPDSMGSLPTYFSIQPEGAVSPTGNQLVSGQTFANDPGATKEIVFTIVVTVAANSGLDQRYCTLTATGSAGVTGSTNIIQAASESYINLTSEHLSSTTVTFGANGLSDGNSSVDVDVYSNDDWEVTVED